jgi:hypothetical protein
MPFFSFQLIRPGVSPSPRYLVSKISLLKDLGIQGYPLGIPLIVSKEKPGKLPGFFTFLLI